MSLRTDEFAKWLKSLKDINAKARINVCIGCVSLTGNIGDYKSVGDGVLEMRISYGSGYRIYFSWRGDTLILLLVGGSKSTQRKDIEKAKRLNKEYK